MSDLININHFNFDNNNLFTNFVSDASLYLPAFKDKDDSLYGDSTFNDLQKTYIYNIKDTLKYINFLIKELKSRELNYIELENIIIEIKNVQSSIRVLRYYRMDLFPIY